MRRIPEILLGAVLAAGVLASGAAFAPAARAQGTANLMHPAFPVLDEAGLRILATGAAPSSGKTCGACHDAVYIDAHNPHSRDGRTATCAQCHFDGSRLPTDPALFDEAGLLRREAIRIGTPRDENCAFCHGIVHRGSRPVAIPDDFETAVPGTPGVRTYALTRDTGEILSPQAVGDSWLNLKDKATRTAPWDVHARRLVACTDCHFARNNPAKADVKHTTLDFLRNDPRRIPLSQFLRRPDHELVAATCRSCHDPLKVHAFLPYARRHMDTLDCRACHVPNLAGPAARSVDATVVLPGGGPRVEYRGLDRADGESLNTAFGNGYVPFLLARTDPAEGTRIAPFNLVTRWFWASGPTGDEVPFDTVRAAWFQGETYDDDVVRALDGNGDGRLDAAEVRLDSRAAIEVLRIRLQARGVIDPRIRSAIVPRPVNHDVQAGPGALRDCSQCHAEQSRLNASIPLASGPFPGGVLPSLPDSGGLPLSGSLNAPDGKSLVLQRDSGAALHVFGHSRGTWIDRIGFLAFVAVLAGVAIHGGMRFRTRGLHPHGDRPTRKIYLYTAYERVWHWLMAFSILALMATGLEVHFGGSWTLLGLPLAVLIHNVFAVVMVVNAFLSLFYHLASDAIRQFVPAKDGLPGQVAAQARYYLQGIFVGQPHPAKTADRKLNPLQQITYLGLLNVLFPFQVATGVLIWGASRWPDFASSIGGLTAVAPLHNLGSWLFLSFFVLHLYLTTTGRTVLSNVSAMIDGWEEVDVPTAIAKGGSHE
jgi:thiosulfate reductase cytochrome b subunit